MGGREQGRSTAVGSRRERTSRGRPCSRPCSRDAEAGPCPAPRCQRVGAARRRRGVSQSTAGARRAPAAVAAAVPLTQRVRSLHHHLDFVPIRAAPAAAPAPAPAVALRSAISAAGAVASPIIRERLVRLVGRDGLIHRRLKEPNSRVRPGTQRRSTERKVDITLLVLRAPGRPELGHGGEGRTAHG